LPRKIAVLWVDEGLEPLTSREPFRVYRGTLCEAVNDALRDREEKKKQGKLPWLRAGSGEGAAVFNLQGILLLRAAYEEGLARRCEP